MKPEGWAEGESIAGGHNAPETGVRETLRRGNAQGPKIVPALPRCG